ncbi:MAG: dapE [Anaerosporomusa subterranea]|jgi:succinyl-diaminopimelate desuccinylase|nr:dapE [Anaerosporomusa subterranea]
MCTEMSLDTQAEAIELLRSLIQINTTNPPGNEMKLAQWISDWLDKRGICSKIVDLGAGRANLIARLDGSTRKSALLFTGHLDTVPPGSNPWKYDPFAAEQVGDRIYGRGSSDMKGGLAAMLYALVSLKRQEIVTEHDIVLLATAGEEINCLGAQAFVDAGGMKEIAAVVVGEPTNGDVIVAHKGAAWIEITTSGSTAHGSMPHLGVNAILRMNDLLSKLSKRQFIISPNSWLGMPTISINQIQGGVATNVIPDSCTCQVDIRLIPGQTLQNATEMITDVIRELTEADPNFEAQFSVINFREPVACPEGHPIIQNALECVGGPSTVRGVNFYTDASTLLQGKSLPVIFYGPGNDAQAHQPNEFISIIKYLESIRFYGRFARYHL